MNFWAVFQHARVVARIRLLITGMIIVTMDHMHLQLVLRTYQRRYLVGIEGLEPPRPKALGPKPSASANFAISPYSFILVDLRVIEPRPMPCKSSVLPLSLEAHIKQDQDQVFKLEV